MCPTNHCQPETWQSLSLIPAPFEITSLFFLLPSWVVIRPYVRGSFVRKRASSSSRVACWRACSTNTAVTLRVAHWNNSTVQSHWTVLAAPSQYVHMCIAKKCKKDWKRLMSFVIRTLIFVKSWGWEQSENVTSTSPATQITDQISVKLYSDISVRFVLYTVNILVLRKDFIEDCSHLAKAKYMFVSHNHLKPTTTSTAIFFSPQTPNRPQNHSLTKEVPV